MEGLKPEYQSQIILLVTLMITCNSQNTVTQVSLATNNARMENFTKSNAPAGWASRRGLANRVAGAGQVGPPPAGALAWAESGAAAAGAVAVVDLGDGARWLRALHARANASLLLWRAPKKTQQASAPAWLERQRGYVLAGHSLLRLITFFGNDTYNAINISDPNARQFRTHRVLMLNAEAPVILSMSNKCKRKYPEILENLPTTYEVLWAIHQTFRAVFLKELAVKHWVMCFAKLPGMEVISGMVTDSEDNVWQELQTYVFNLSSNLQNITVKTYMPQVAHYPQTHFKVNDIVLTITRPPHILMIELSKHLNLHWYYVTKLFDLNFKDGETPVHVLTNKLALAIWFAKVDFSPCQFIYGLIPWTLMDIISSTAREDATLILVPRSPQLPLWSLPIRVFGVRLWATLVGTALLYTVAWRVVAGESLAASAAAALRAFSSCGGVPQDRVRATPQRLQLAAALLASSVVIISLYQGRLFTLITNPDHYAEIDTFDQLADSGLPVFGPNVAVLQLENNGVEIYTPEKLASRLRVAKLESHITPGGNVARYVKQGRQLAWIETQESWTYYSRAYYVHQRMRPMPETLMSGMAVMHARPNWALTNIINRKYLEFISAGLLIRWQKDMDQTEAIYNRAEGIPWNVVRTEKIEDRPRVFDLTFVIPNLQLLGAGLFLATVAFSVEVCLKNTKAVSGATRDSR